jgi:hypothetical protein
MAGEQQGGEHLVEVLEAVKVAHFDAASGACDFAALVISREHGRLAACLASLAEVDPRRLRSAAQTAFWLNLYNACVLRDALELEVEGFFTRERARVAGMNWSLDDIEHGLLRGNAPKPGSFSAPMKKSDPRLLYMPLAYDERMHFAMYTARHSSPPLRIFHGGALETELEDATRDYLRARVRVKDEDGRAKFRLPKIFQWYAQDFGDERGVLEFVLARLDEEVAELVDRRDGRVKFKYDEFDWALNTRPRPPA